MKHLKSFNESNSSDFYTEESEFDPNNVVSLPLNDIKEIQKSIKSNYKIKFINTDPNIIKIEKKSILPQNTCWVVRLYEDEWYWVWEHNYERNILGQIEYEDIKYYKCDQLDGVIKLLEDKGIC
jgi:hypothetical protein